MLINQRNGGFLVHQIRSWQNCSFEHGVSAVASTIHIAFTLPHFTVPPLSHVSHVVRMGLFPTDCDTPEYFRTHLDSMETSAEREGVLFHTPPSWSLKQARDWRESGSHHVLGWHPWESCGAASGWVWRAPPARSVASRCTRGVRACWTRYATGGNWLAGWLPRHLLLVHGSRAGSPARWEARSQGPGGEAFASACLCCIYAIVWSCGRRGRWENALSEMGMYSQRAFWGLLGRG